MRVRSKMPDHPTHRVATGNPIVMLRSRLSRRWSGIEVDLIPQIQGEGAFRILFRARKFHRPRRVAQFEKPREATAFRFISIHRQGGVVASAGMRYVIGASAN